MRSKSVVVTGGFGVLGQAAARAAAAKGAKVAVLDAAPTAPAGLNADLGPSAVVLSGADLTDDAAAQHAVSTAAERLGGIDVLLNIAGTFRWETIQEGATATWDLLHAVNVKTTLSVSRAALPHLLKSSAGRIVNVGANGAVKAGLGMGAYAASKAGVHRLTESLAEELKGKGVTVNAVLPSIIDTPNNRADMPNEDFSKWVKPEAVAAIMLFLASEEAGDITGALLPVTGRV